MKLSKLEEEEEDDDDDDDDDEYQTRTLGAMLTNVRHIGEHRVTIRPERVSQIFCPFNH